MHPSLYTTTSQNRKGVAGKIHTVVAVLYPKVDLHYGLAPTDGTYFCFLQSLTHPHHLAGWLASLLCCGFGLTVGHSSGAERYPSQLCISPGILLLLPNCYKSCRCRLPPAQRTVEDRPENIFSTRVCLFFYIFDTKSRASCLVTQNQLLRGSTTPNLVSSYLHIWIRLILVSFFFLPFFGGFKTLSSFLPSFSSIPEIFLEETRGDSPKFGQVCN